MLSHSVVYLFNQMKCKSWKIYRLIVVDKWKSRYCFKIIMKKVFQHLCTVRASFNFLIACSNFHGISYSNLYSLLVVFARLFVCLKERNAVHQAWRCIGWILNEQQFNFKTLQKFHWSFFHQLQFECVSFSMKEHEINCGAVGCTQWTRKYVKIAWWLLILCGVKTFDCNRIIVDYSE